MVSGLLVVWSGQPVSVRAPLCSEDTGTVRRRAVPVLGCQEPVPAVSGFISVLFVSVSLKSLQLKCLEKKEKKNPSV